jgi:glycine/D-amino acid oxidase-like deaminating enzyme
MPDVVVVGAGIIGAACAYYARRAGLTVTVVDRGGVAGGTTGAGEGNILVSDKEPGPELDLALRSHALWRGLELGDIELEAKGGLVVAASEAQWQALQAFAAAQAGVVAQPVSPWELEPGLAPDVTGALYYPQDLQVQPMLAAARLLRGIPLRLGVTVRALEPGRVVTDDGVINAAAIINAAGVWAGALGALPIQPRRGFILVTARQPVNLVRHKVYAASYVSNVASREAGLQASAVVEGTRAGTVLIGSSRERVGLDPAMALPVLRVLARNAIQLFPALRDVPVIRAYRGFRPYTTDHLPVIGPDPRVPGLYHACGHEGAGVGLAPITGKIIADLVSGAKSDVDIRPFRPERFGA